MTSLRNMALASVALALLTLAPVAALASTPGTHTHSPEVHDRTPRVHLHTAHVHHS